MVLGLEKLQGLCYAEKAALADGTGNRFTKGYKVISDDKVKKSGSIGIVFLPGNRHDGSGTGGFGGRKRLLGSI